PAASSAVSPRCCASSRLYAANTSNRRMGARGRGSAAGRAWRWSVAAIASVRPRGAAHVVVGVHVDVVLLRRSQDLLRRLVLRRLALEVRPAEALDGVADVLLVVDRQVALAVAVDVGEVGVFQALALLGRQLCHAIPPLPP